jgi:ER membrane protein complex subunit 3
MNHDIQLDPAIRDWVLIPIMIVMVLIGVLRHYITLLMQSPAKANLKAVREAYLINHARFLII